MSKLLFMFTVLAVLSWQLCLVLCSCNVCQINDVACINQTSFHMCFGGTTPHTDYALTCPDGLVCTDQPNVCFQRINKPASCGDTSSCGLCNQNNVFACTSRTTFAFCFGNTKPTGVNGTCPIGSFCDASSVNVCVSEAVDKSIICHLD